MTFKVNKINTIEEYLVKDEYDYAGLSSKVCK